jgi:hypothetical protein
MQIVAERYVGVLADYSVIYLIECTTCYALLGFPGQGHVCDGSPLTAIEIVESIELAELVEKLKKVYPLPKFLQGQ